jgi:hypothetical protein
MRGRKDYALDPHQRAWMPSSQPRDNEPYRAAESIHQRLTTHDLSPATFVRWLSCNMAKRAIRLNRR